MANITNVNSNLSTNAGIQGAILTQLQPKIVKFMLPSVNTLDPKLWFDLNLEHIFCTNSVISEEEFPHLL